ncbi:MAG: hypothetical protein V7K90_24475 [Nostoc sp.]
MTKTQISVTIAFVSYCTQTSVLDAVLSIELLLKTFYGLKVVTMVTLTPRIILGKIATPAIATKYPIEAKRLLFRGR